MGGEGREPPKKEGENSMAEFKNKLNQIVCLDFQSSS